MKYDVIILGAGLSGLAAGIRLACFEKKVCIVEKHVEIGGLNSFYEMENRSFDVGLHAMTNYTPKGVRSSPLGKLLKQLRFKHDDFQLCQQKGSEIHFPGVSLKFSNDFELLRQEIAQQFPSQIDRFDKLTAKIRQHDDLSLKNGFQSSRAVLAEFLTEPKLSEMLFCPLMFYGNPQEHDMDFTQFTIMFKAIFFEGFAKPLGGMRYILSLMADKYKGYGGELKMGRAVKSISITNGEVQKITLTKGEELEAKIVISSIGYAETMRLSNHDDIAQDNLQDGEISFIESQYVLNQQPSDLGYDKSIIFFNTRDEFNYRKPEEMVDLTSGIVCCANNFDYPEPQEGLIRFTFLANPHLWMKLSREKYKEAKAYWQEKTLETIVGFLPDFRDSVVFLDTFTPKTIKKFTGHSNGAVYGSPNKIRNGRTSVKNLFICGTDQGFLGIIGATLSGVTVANIYGLKGSI
jgi:phytoene dehydrogenase-like protein